MPFYLAANAVRYLLLMAVPLIHADALPRLIGGGSTNHFNYLWTFAPFRFMSPRSDRFSSAGLEHQAIDRSATHHTRPRLNYSEEIHQHDANVRGLTCHVRKSTVPTLRSEYTRAFQERASALVGLQAILHRQLGRYVMS
ncbi:hypothetical protein FB451DRAFT_1222216 [Mycena latifolia]|nr:hypothetical protein FB451DRAFT_1222216 [Mycena latifolia]